MRTENHIKEVQILQKINKSNNLLTSPSIWAALIGALFPHYEMQALNNLKLDNPKTNED